MTTVVDHNSGIIRFSIKRSFLTNKHQRVRPMNNSVVCTNRAFAKELDEAYLHLSPNCLSFGPLHPTLRRFLAASCSHEFLLTSRTHLQIYPLHLHFIQSDLDSPNLFVQWRWATQAHQGYSCAVIASPDRSNHPFPFLTNRLGYYKYGINSNRCWGFPSSFKITGHFEEFSRPPPLPSSHHGGLPHSREVDSPDGVPDGD